MVILFGCFKTYGANYKTMNQIWDLFDDIMPVPYFPTLSYDGSLQQPKYAAIKEEGQMVFFVLKCTTSDHNNSLLK